MAIKKRRVTLVYIRWFDSSMTSVETIDPKDAASTLENESSGILICEDSKSVTIALDRCIDTDGIRCTLCVPKVNVRSIRRFKTG